METLNFSQKAFNLYSPYFDKDHNLIQQRDKNISHISSYYIGNENACKALMSLPRTISHKISSFVSIQSEIPSLFGEVKNSSILTVVITGRFQETFNASVGYDFNDNIIKNTNRNPIFHSYKRTLVLTSPTAQSQQGGWTLTLFH
jgi:hypothetical protein